MEAPAETPPDAQINGPDSPNNDTSYLSDRDDLRAELQSQSAATEETLVLLQREGDVVADLTKVVDEISRERDSLRDKVDEFEASLKDKENELARKLDEELRKTEDLKREVEVSRERIHKLETEIKERNGLMLDLLRVSKGTLKRILESVDEDEEEKAESMSVGGEEEEEDEEEIAETRRVAREAEEKVRDYKEKRRKEKRELEKSVVSLTEENRDINSLLRAALVEKEAVEKSLSKLKGNNSNEQKRVALLQIAERGLQRVGFGFMMGTTGTTTTTSGTSSSEQQTHTSSDTSECEEEEINATLVCYFVVYMICNI